MFEVKIEADVTVNTADERAARRVEHKVDHLLDMVHELLQLQAPLVDPEKMAEATARMEASRKRLAAATVTQPAT